MTKTIVDPVTPTEEQQHRMGQLLDELHSRFDSHADAVLIYGRLMKPGHYRAMAEVANDIAALIESLPPPTVVSYQ